MKKILPVNLCKVLNLHNPVVFCGMFPVDSDEYEHMRDSMVKLALNDSSFSYEPEVSPALGYGFRCGFLVFATLGNYT